MWLPLSRHQAIARARCIIPVVQDPPRQVSGPLVARCHPNGGNNYTLNTLKVV